MNKKVGIYISIALVISILCVAFTHENKKYEPKEVYRVYLKGKSLGLIESKVQLENYIDEKQQKIKKKYNVDKVYAPDELDIIKEITFNEKIDSYQSIYKKIENISPFTIDGFTVTIKGLEKTNSEGKKETEKDTYIYTLDKNNFKKAAQKTIQSFVSKDKYAAYENDNQQEIKETGSIIENLYIKNKISIKKNKIPVDKDIYQTEEEISKILLFGTLEDQQKYTVQSGDTIEDVAFNNKISTEEFLIANTDFKDEKSLLFEGQQVTIGILKPQFDLIEEDHVVVDQEVNYETETKYDSSKSRKYSEVEQAGVKGKNRVTQKIQKINGETTNVVTIATEELSAPVKEIIVKGGRDPSSGGGGGNVSGYGVAVATKGEWGWPATCMTVSSPFGYRWGALHDAIDIAGCGYGSNIFAAQSGTVVKVSYKYDNGKYVIIDHHNGYYSLYAHLSGQAVKEGQAVTKGQVIGAMGKTGFATGVHVHFAIWNGYPYYGGRVLNPMNFY